MNYQLIQGNCLSILPTLPEASVQCCVTSPPYFGLRDYGVDGQIGLEPSIGDYVAAMTAVFREVWRVLKPDGVLWLNLGDSYNGSGGSGGDYSAGGLKEGQPKYPGRSIKSLPPKSLIGIPWRVAFALQDDGWILRSDIIWHKPNPMPESVTDRPTRAHEYMFLFAKQAKYYYNAEAIKEPAQEHTGQAAIFARSSAVSEHIIPGQSAAQHRPNRVDKQRGHSRRHDGFNDRWDNMTKTEQCAGMRNKRDVWTVAPAVYAEAHFATFPPALIEPCILAGSAPGDTVLDPFSGSGTTVSVALQHNRDAIGIELNPAYIELSHTRIGRTQISFLMEG
jgi:DNA modification methylase